MSQRRQRVLLLLGSGLLALVLAETCLWLLNIPKSISSFGFLGNVFDEAGLFEEDPDLFWRLRRDTNRYRVNDLGLRGPGVPLETGPRNLRIACFGDSCTFGSLVRLEDTYGWLLQERLQEKFPNRRVEVILAGLPGYSSYQSLALFQEHIAARKPDITVLYIGGYNDYVPAMGENDSERGARLASERNSLWRRWRLVRLCARILAPKPKLTRAEYVAAFERGEAPDGRRVPVADFQKNLEVLIGAAEEVGSTVLVLVPPLPKSTLHKHPVARDYRRTLIEVAKATGVQLVDPTAAFASYEVANDSVLPKHQRGYWPCFVDWVHPSVLGHGLLAEALVETLRDYPRDNPSFGPHGSARRPVPDSVVAGNHQRVTVGRGYPEHSISRIMVGRWWAVLLAGEDPSFQALSCKGPCPPAPIPCA